MSLGKSSIKRVYTTLILLHSNPCCVNKAGPEASVCALQPFLLRGVHSLGDRMPKGGLAACFVHMNFESMTWRTSSVL